MKYWNKKTWNDRWIVETVFKGKRDGFFVEAGAQGPHKIQRGYMPEKTWSLHWIKSEKFKKAISQYLNEEIYLMNKEKKNLEQFTPFKQI